MYASMHAFSFIMRVWMNGCVHTQVLFANQTPGDIILRDELDGMVQAFPTRVKVWHTVERFSGTAEAEAWSYSTGRICARLLADHLPAPGPAAFVGMCGPRAMVEEACLPRLKQMGFPESSLFVF